MQERNFGRNTKKNIIKTASTNIKPVMCSVLLQYLRETTQFDYLLKICGLNSPISMYSEFFKASE